MKKRLILPLFLVAMPVVASVYMWSVDSPAPSSPKEQKLVEPEEPELVDEINNPWVNDQLSKLTLREKIGQFFMVAAYSNKGEAHFRKIDSLVVRDKIGGIIFFQGQRDNLKIAIDRFQGEAKVPLLVAMDAEWGVSMRLFGENRFPYNYTIGAANDPALTERISEMMGQECRELGIHMNFAPVADVNSNPNNPVIGFRSYGENPMRVSKLVAATVKGMERQSVMTSVKHFPGHGDTDVDSHKDLPIVNNTYKHISAIDFVPFKGGIDAGASSVMIGHLNVPALDPSGTPSSLSSKTIQGYLKGELGFKGLVVSDALGMKAVANRYGKTEVVVKAFVAGCDILLFPESVEDAIDAIEQKVNEGEISEEEVDIRCKRVLYAKYKSIVKPGKLKSYSAEEQELARKQLFEKAITVIKNDNVFPLKRFDQKIAVVSIGSHADALKESMRLVTKDVDHFHYYSGGEALRSFKKGNYDVVITTVHAKSMRARNDYGMPAGWRDWLKGIGEKKSAMVLFGNPLALKKNVDLSTTESVVVAYENHELMMDRVGQFIVGAFEANGKLPISINSEYKDGHGVNVPWGGRLKESQPEELNISPDKLAEIDAIIEKGIQAGAFPGCQVAIAIDGKMIYRKSFGYHTYDKKRAVLNDDVYDIASITKIAASTASLMKLNSEGKINLEQTLGDHLPELMGDSPLKNIKLRHMLSHQAGLTPWIPFYTKTLLDGKPSNEFYSPVKTEEFDQQVSENLWIKSSYEGKMYDAILGSNLGAKRYKYSDLGYYFIKEIVKKHTGQTIDQYALNEFYRPMGLSHMRYNPLNYFPKSRITPTEDDKIFRQELVHGYVHDQGAAMMGGVGGHAGVFSNAGDLASLMQMFLNKGEYGGVRYINEQVIEEYTDCQYCSKNRRGAGFDKPTRDRKGGPTSDLVSLESFGHSGFTGTLAWADPSYDVNYVFLSNRVYPDAENWKIVKMDIRTDIQKVIYEALSEARK